MEVMLKKPKCDKQGWIHSFPSIRVGAKRKQSVQMDGQTDQWSKPVIVPYIQLKLAKQGYDNTTH